MVFQFANKRFRALLVLILCVAILIVAGLSARAYLAANKDLQSTMPALGDEDKNLGIKPLSATDDTAIEERWGVRLQGIHITAAGHMLDFRFQVTDPGKAAPLMDTKNKPIVIVEGSGIKLEVPNTPRIGALRQTSKQVKQGMIFTILFANPGKMVATGQKLAVRIADFSVEHITVGEILNTPLKPTKNNGQE